MLRWKLSRTLALAAVLTAAMSAQPRRHAVAVSDVGVRISISTLPGSCSSIDIAQDHWIARGYDLRSLIAEIYEIDARRIDLPDTSVTSARYDVSASLPEDADKDQVQRLLQKALQDKFKIAIIPESRAMEVYVITAPTGAGPALHGHASLPATPVAKDISGESAFDAGDQQRFTYQAQVCPGISSSGISASAGTMAEFRRTLEPTLDRPVVNETNLIGTYDFEISEFHSKEELFRLLQKELGLVVIPSQREIIVLTVHIG